MINQLKNIGLYNIKTYENGVLKEETEIKNLITNAYLNELIKIPQGQSSDFQIKYVAVGTGTTVPDVDDTQLETETFRFPVTTRDVTGNGELTTTFVVIDTAGVGQWNEIGIFCGSTATSTPNSGVLASRVLINKDKKVTEEVTISRKDIFVRG